MSDPKDPKDLEQTALSITRAVGSPRSMIIHTVLFAASFGAAFSGYISFDRMLLILTTIVSLEAIYLAIFIQISVNLATASLEEVEQDIDEIQKDVDEIQEDVDEIQEDVEEMSEEEAEEEQAEAAQQKTLADIQRDLSKLVQDIEKLQNQPRT